MDGENDFGGMKLGDACGCGIESQHDGSREGCFAGHGAAGLGKLFLCTNPEQQQRPQAAHAGERIPTYQQGLCGTPGAGKHSWHGNKQWFGARCSTKGGEENPSLLQENMKGEEEEQSHSSEDQQLQGAAAPRSSIPWCCCTIPGGSLTFPPTARKGLCLHLGDAAWT